MPAAIATSSIVAQAFRYMELGPISSFGDASPQAIDATDQYPVALNISLEAADWSFASRLVNLPPAELGATAAIDPDMPYLFALPGDAIMLRDVGDQTTRWRRDVEGLRADTPGPLRVRYTRAVENEAALPATFRDAVALRLALMLAPRWLTTQSKVATLENRAETALKAAMRADGRMASIARYDGRPSEGDWVTEAQR